MRAVFGVEEGPRHEELKRRIRAMIDPIAIAPRAARCWRSPAAASAAGAAERFEDRRAAVDELIYDEIARRRDAPDLDEREDVLSMLLLARDEDGEAMTDARAARRARHAARGRARDHRHRARLGVRAAAAQPARCSRGAGRRGGGRHGLPRRRGQGDAAAAAGDRRRRPRGARRAVRAGRLRDPGRASRSTRRSPAIHRRARPLPGSRASSAPSASSATTRPTPTPGCPFGGGTRRCLGASFATLRDARRDPAGARARASSRRPAAPEKGVRKGDHLRAEARRARGAAGAGGGCLPAERCGQQHGARRVAPVTLLRPRQGRGRLIDMRSDGLPPGPPQSPPARC